MAIREVDGQPLFTTKGDANAAADAREVVLPEGANIVVTSISYLGYLVIFAHSLSGIMVLVAAPALVLLLLEVTGGAESGGGKDPDEPELE